MVYDSVFNVLLSCRQSLIDDLRTIRCFFFLLLSATFISYHRFKYLSTTFLFIFVVKLSLSNNSYMIPCIFSVVNNFFIFLPSNCYNNFALPSVCYPLSSDSLYIIIHYFTFVNCFSSIFYIFSSSLHISIILLPHRLFIL